MGNHSRQWHVSIHCQRMSQVQCIKMMGDTSVQPPDGSCSSAFKCMLQVQCIPIGGNHLSFHYQLVVRVLQQMNSGMVYV